MLTKRRDLEAALRACLHSAERPVLFEYEGVRLTPGFHVTEVKRQAVSGIDCGQQVDRWEECVIEILDGTSRRSSAPISDMSIGKLSGILAKASARLDCAADARVFVEFGPSNASLRKLQIASVEPAENHVLICLKDLSARCKPWHRAIPFSDKLAEMATASSCCGQRSRCCA